MRQTLIIVLTILACNVFAQNYGAIGMPGTPPDTIYLANNAADSMGIIRPSGYVLIGDGTNLPDTSAGLFWDGTKLGIGTNAPEEELHIVSTNGTATDLLLESTLGSGTEWKIRVNGSNGIFVLIDNNSSTQPFKIEESAPTNAFFIEDSGRIGIGTATPTGALDVTSTTGAFLPPRMTTTQRNALSASAGMVIYNTTTSKLQVYTTSWVDLH